MKISVVVPVYGCPEALQPLCSRVIATVNRIGCEYEIILVNDGCPRGSWGIIEKLCETNNKIIGVNLSRNFGQINATNAGLELSTGDYVVLMDCDLQDPPEAIEDLFLEISKGYDIVFAARKDRKDKGIVKATSRLFYKIYNHSVEGHFDPDIANYCMVRRYIVDMYCQIPEHDKAYTVLLSWMGFKTSTLSIVGEERAEGKSSYNLGKKINMAIDMLTSQSNKPLISLVKIGAVIDVIAVVYLVVQLAIFFVEGDTPSGWMSLTAIVILLGGIQLMALGVIGIYIGKMFNELKNRQPYYIQEIINQDRND